MPLVVPALRISVLFLNVWETFKTLKHPRPSSRNNGQPSARAMMQRKRNMKGCLAVWIVWCCFALYEASLDGIVGIFIPFYDEMKAVLLVFMLMTRAKGAEPIYLHVLRPLLKPYVPLLDSMLEATALFGGFFIMLASIPVQYAMSWWNGSAPHLDEAHRPDNLSDISSMSLNGYDAEPLQSTPPVQSRAASQEGRPPYSRNSTIRPVPGNGLPSMYLATNGRSTGGSRNNGPSAYSQTRTSSASSSAHQFWHPPPSAYEDQQVSSNGTPAIDGLEEAVDDWRQYPAFPSAYPPTPITASSRLSEKTTADSNNHPVGDDEWRQYPPFPSAYPATPLTNKSKLPSLTAAMHSAEAIPEETSELTDADDASEEPGQGFDRSLKQPQNTHPSSDGNLSDNIAMTGVKEHHNLSETMSESLDETMVSDESCEESEYGVEEDSFDISFRTPRQLRDVKAARAKDDLQATVTRRSTAKPMSVALTSSSSYHSQSTALSTTDYGSSLRTAISRSPSQSSVSSALSDAVSVAGKKRTRILRSDSSVINKTSSTESSEEMSRTAVATIPRKTSLKLGSRTLRPAAAITRSRPKIPLELFTDDEGDDELGTSDSEGHTVKSGAKRRKVVAATGETKSIQERRAGLRPRTTSENGQPNPKVTTTRVRKRPGDQSALARKPSTSSMSSRRSKTKQTSSESTQKVNNVWK